MDFGGISEIRTDSENSFEPIFGKPPHLEISTKSWLIMEWYKYGSFLFEF